MESPTTQPAPEGESPADVLKRFQEASSKFIRANAAAQEAACAESAKLQLDFQQQVRSVEQDASRAIADAIKRHIERAGQQGSSRPEDVYSLHAQAQLDFEREIRQIYADAEGKLREIAQKTSGEGGSGLLKQVTDSRQEAYQAYVADLQQAWASTKALDPQTMNAIASTILCTINMS
jgi:hypothetical protein